MSDFPAHQLEQWEALAQAALKGASPWQKLEWKNRSGLKLAPLYTQRRGGPLFARETWQLRQRVAPDLEEVSLALAMGAEALTLSASGDLPESELRKLLAKISAKPLYLEGCAEPDGLPVFTGGADYDPILGQNFDRGFRWLEFSGPNFVPLVVDGTGYREAGCTPLQELTFLLAGLVENIRHFDQSGVSPSQLLCRLELRSGCGPEFFSEVAKLRALHRCLLQLCARLGVARPSIHVRDLALYHTMEDPHLNLLRSTAAAVAAVVGGCDSLELHPFQPGPEGLRAAIAQQHLMRCEGFLQETMDAAAGSYFVEHLTEEMARRAWAGMQELERTGGLSQSLAGGQVKAEIQQARARFEQELAIGKASLLGANTYPPPGPHSAAKTRRQLPAELGPFRRLAEPYEQLKSGTRPRLTLLPAGEPRMRSARAQFAQNFLAVGGFELLSLPACDTLEQARERIAQVETGLVLCADDESLPDLVAAAGDKYLIVASAPLELEGVNQFIHRRADRLQTLAKIGDELHELA